MESGILWSEVARKSPEEMKHSLEIKSQEAVSLFRFKKPIFQCSNLQYKYRKHKLDPGELFSVSSKSEVLDFLRRCMREMAVLLSEPDKKKNQFQWYFQCSHYEHKNLFDTVGLTKTISTTVYMKHHFTSLPSKERNSLQLTKTPDFYFNCLCHRIWFTAGQRLDWDQHRSV